MTGRCEPKGNSGAGRLPECRAEGPRVSVAHAAIRPVRGVILDVDGVLVFQGKVMEDAPETIEALREQGIILRFLTNSTMKSRRSCAEQLRRAGVLVDRSEVITASYATAVYVASLRPRSCWIVLDGDGREEFDGIPQNDESPEYVVVGDGRSRFDFVNLNHVLRLLLKGAGLIGMQGELVDRSAGPPELNVGSWVGMLERAAGTRAVYVGKPSRYAFDLTLRSMGLSPHDVLMVGDKVSTDIAGANRAGMRSVLVRTGEYDERELDGTSMPDFMVDYVYEVVSIVRTLNGALRTDASNESHGRTADTP